MFVEITKSRLALVQSILGPVAIGYIVARGDDAIDSAVRRAQWCDLKIDPSHLAAATGVLQIQSDGLAREAPRSQLVHRRIGPARRIGERLPDHGLTGSTDGLQHLHVASLYPPLSTHYPDIPAAAV